MKKLSEINEGMFSGMVRRSNTNQVKKEDDINHLDKNDFYEYIKKYYDVKADKFVKLLNDNDTIHLPLFLEKVLYNYYKIEFYLCFTLGKKYKEAYIHGDALKKYPELNNVLSNNFNLEQEVNYYIILPKNNEPVDNIFFIKILNTIIDNTDITNLKRKEVNEGMFSGMVRRSNTEQVKKEDDIGNISKLKPVDMNTSVLWADDDLCIEGNYFFEFDDAIHYDYPNGWRLPTINEVRELKKVTTVSTSDKEYIVNSSNNKLTFIKRGFLYGKNKMQVDQGAFYYGWTSDECNDKQVHIISFEYNEMVCTPKVTHSFMDYVLQQKIDSICIRLVKDK